MSEPLSPSPSKNRASSADKPKRGRDPVRSKQTILRTAIAEFAQHGFSGARVERIAAKSKSNMRMIYHYFGNKEGLYLAVLEAAYARIRSGEATLDLARNDPVVGMRTLIRYTFDFFESNRDVLALIHSENIMKGQFLKKLPHVQAMTLPLLNSIGYMLDQGRKTGRFRVRIDPVQFYVSLVALSQLHILNRHTLSVIFGQDISDPKWLKERRVHIEEMLMGYLEFGAPQKKC